MSISKIEWTDATWNPVTGCYGPSGSAAHPRICGYCYAYRMARRLQGRYGYPPAPDFFKPTLHPDRMEQPLRWRKPRMVFVCSMADLFGAWVPDTWIEQVLEVVRATPQHTYQFLTKWPQRLARWNPFPTNAWVGASATNIQMLVNTIAELTKIEASVRFISAEPWLGRRTDSVRMKMIDWLIIGQQTGPGAKKIDTASVDALIAAARWDAVPIFIKPPLAYRDGYAGIEEYPTTTWRAP